MEKNILKTKEVIWDNQYTDAQLSHKVNGIYNRFVKRTIDFVLAMVAIVLLSPVLLAVSLAILLDSGAPVFYRAWRGGYQNKPFKILKFRSMVKNADQIGGYTTALHDPRITKTGRFLRKTKLDEIPQLFNIIKGEMSFVGPRPEVLAYVNMFKNQEKYILQVRPGITDYSSLKFADMDAVVGDGDVDKFFLENILAEKNRLRVQYVAEISFKTDLSIFIRTFLHVAGHFFKKRNHEGN